MSVTATGPLSIQFAGAETLLAHSATWQAVTSSANATAARERIHYPFIVDPSDLANGDRDETGQRPLAVLSRDPSNHFRMSRMGQQEGSLNLYLQLPVPEDYDDSPPDALLQITNQVGAVLLEMLVLANTQLGDGSQHWNLTRVEEVAPPAECHAEEEDIPHGDPLYYDCLYRLYWNR